MYRLVRIPQFFVSQAQGQRFFFIFGPPGVGKGTYSKLIKKDFQLNHISAGHLIKKFLRDPSPVFDQKVVDRARELDKQDKLMDDDLVIKLIQRQVDNQESRKGIILDGFPKNVEQLDRYLKLYPAIHAVINLSLNEKVLIDTLKCRRACKSCGTVFNYCLIEREGYVMQPLMPRKAGVCDNCGDELIIRQDDTQRGIKRKLEQYQRETKPLLKWFDKMGVLIDFQPKRGVKDYPQLKKLIQEELKHTQSQPV